MAAYVPLGPASFLRGASVVRSSIDDALRSARTSAPSTAPARVVMLADVVSQHARGPQREKKPPAPIPTVSFGDSQMDVFSRLAKDRILVLGTQVTDEVANQLVAQMLFLSADDPNKDITLFINSPGGSVSAGMAIFDTMQYIPCDVATTCFGSAASMGAFLLCAGAKGKRKSLPNSRIMIHQPLGGAQGQAADMEVQAKEIMYVRSLLNAYMSYGTGQPVEKIAKDCDRDFFMTAQQAKDYGIIDEVIETRRMMSKPAMPTIH
jgi:ATP-dependent Clp protease, protease subunit